MVRTREDAEVAERVIEFEAVMRGGFVALGGAIYRALDPIAQQIASLDTLPLPPRLKARMDRSLKVLQRIREELADLLAEWQA